MDQGEDPLTASSPRVMYAEAVNQPASPKLDRKGKGETRSSPIKGGTFSVDFSQGVGLSEVGKLVGYIEKGRN